MRRRLSALLALALCGVAPSGMAKTHAELVGDLDLDGSVDVRDVQCFAETLGALAGAAPACLAEVPELLDMDCDGDVDSDDVAWVVARAGGWLPDPSIDLDGDWRPDACDWDDDGDGVLDTCELALGTSPVDPSSAPPTAADCPPPCGAGCPDSGDPCLAAECEDETGLCDLLPTAGSCDDGQPCTVGDACLGGVCGGTPKDCSGLDEQCSVGLCEPATGTCVSISAAGGATCDDGDPCTEETTCSGGACSGGAPVECPDIYGPCALAVCDPGLGCVAAPVADGGDCFDPSLCSAPGTCVSGTCDCPAPDCSLWDGECTNGALDPETGGCVATPKVGAICNLDFNACTVDTCGADGACHPGSVPDCSARDDACNQGVCSPVTPVAWVCSALPAPGTTCADSTPCTEGLELCQLPALAAWAYDHGAVTSALVLDHAGGGYHGVPNDGAWLLDAGPTGHALACDGIAGEVLVDDHPALAVTGQVLSMATHFRADDAGAFSQVLLARDGSYMLGTNAGYFSCAVKVDGNWAWYGSGAVSTDVWHHGGCTFDGTHVRVYLDGALTDAVPQAGSLTPQPGPLRLCARELGMHFAGDLADTRLYTRVLDAGEMWSLYANPDDAGASSTCGGGVWDPFCCESDAHCGDQYGCTADTCVGGLCENPPAFPCDLPGNGCFFEFCEDNPATGEPWCNGNLGGYGDWVWHAGFEVWESAGTHHSGWQLLSAAAASQSCGWHHVSSAQLLANVPFVAGGCPEGSACLYVGNTDTWDYDHGTCDAGLYGPSVQIPTAGEAWLQLSYWAEVLDLAPGKDRLEVHVDGAAVAIKEGSQLYTSGQWQLLTVNMAAFADGQAHELSIHFKTGDGVLNTGAGLIIDDLRLWVDDPSCQ